jgi:hypothetical protein
MILVAKVIEMSQPKLQQMYRTNPPAREPLPGSAPFLARRAGRRSEFSLPATAAAWVSGTEQNDRTKESVVNEIASIKLEQHEYSDAAKRVLYLRNAWYFAALEEDLADRPMLNRTILEEPVLLFKGEDGVISAIGDRCPHRRRRNPRDAGHR